MLYNDLYFNDYSLAIETGEIDTITEIKRQKAINTNMVVNSLELTLTKKTMKFLGLSIKYLDTSNNEIKKNFNK